MWTPTNDKKNCCCKADDTTTCTWDKECACKKETCKDITSWWTCCSDNTDWWCCSDTNTWSCGCAGDGSPLDLSVEQIKRINEILGDIDDEDLETGNYDLDEEQAHELNNILFGK